MVSNLYTAKTFYKKQNKGKVMKNSRPRGKLYKDNKGFYIYNKSREKGDKYNKMYIPENAKVYARADKVSVYSKSKDKSRIDVRHEVDSPAYHEKVAHKYDRETYTGRERKY